MGMRPAKADEKWWGRRFRLPTLDLASGWQAEAPAPPRAPNGTGLGWGFSNLSHFRFDRPAM
jgi:hypothetical protein